MANSKGPSTMRSMPYTGKHPLLPPKSPFPTMTPSYSDYVPNSAIAPPVPPRYRDANSHQRTSSESFLIEEQPFWLDDLLNEPESPVRRGHRRSSSDSFTYMEAANAVFNNDYRLRNLSSVPSWGPQDFDMYKDSRNPSFFGKHNSVLMNRSQNVSTHSNASLDVNKNSSIASEKKDAVEPIKQDGDSSERKDLSSIKSSSSSETDTKRAKQQFAQRSRVRKLQYIAELEKNVQALQAEGSEVSAEVEFLNQQSIILGMENKALKQRLENLAQEQIIKYMEHEVLEREIGRLRALYQHQQQPPQKAVPPPPGHRRTASKDKLESQFANLSLKKDSGSTGPLHT